MTSANMKFLALAGQAGRSFLEQGVALDQAIAKIASSENLNPLQIQRVVEASNHYVNDALRAKSEDKTYRFDVASTDGVLSHLNAQPMGKTAAEIRYAFRSLVGAERSTASLNKLAEAVSDSPARKRVAALGTIESLRKIAARLTTYRRATLAKQAGLADGIRSDWQELRQYAQDYAYDGKPIADLHKFACSARPESAAVWDVIFPQLREEVIKLSSPTGNPASSKLRKQPPIHSSDKVPHTVVNGTHGLLVLLDSFRNKISETDQASSRLRLMDTFGPAIVQQIKPLSTGEEIRKDLDERIYKLAEAMEHSSSIEEGLVALAKEANMLMAPFHAAAKGVGMAGSAAKGLWRHKGKIGLGLGAAALFGAASSAGKALRPELRNWQPGSERGVNYGGSAAVQ